MSELKTSAWMWAAANGGTNGATIDTIDKVIQWFDAVGCACGDSMAVQNFEQFRQQGSPLGGMPDDVREEMLNALALLDK